MSLIYITNFIKFSNFHQMQMCPSISKETLNYKFGEQNYTLALES